MSSPGSTLDGLAHSQVINLVRSGQALTRPAIEQQTGLGRRVVAQRVQQAIEVGLLEDGDLAPSEGGRPSRQLRFRADAGYVLTGMINAPEITAAVCHLDGTPVATLHERWISDEPDATMAVLDRMFTRLQRRMKTEPWAIGVGVAGPVDFTTGRLVAPPILPGWDGYSVRSWFRERYDAPIWVDNDVNLMALGEWHMGSPRDGRDLLYVLVDTGIGAGLVSGGQVFRGDTGAAGDIGHIQVTDDPAVLCRCGQIGCLEAVAGGWGVVQTVTSRVAESPYLQTRLAAQGRLIAEDIGLGAAIDDPLCMEVMINSGRVVGSAVANVVNFANPGTVVIGGGALRGGPQMFSAMEETIRQRVSRLAGLRLAIRPASLNFREGVTGAGLMAIENLFKPASLGVWIDSGSPVGRAVRVQQQSSL